MPDYYVYLHKEEDTGNVFYVGKGKNGRAWHFTSRTDAWKEIQREHGVTVEIVTGGLTEAQAMSIEAELIRNYIAKGLAKANLFVPPKTEDFSLVEPKTPDDMPKIFGSRLRLLRECRGMSQETLAQRCGVDRTYVSAIDRGGKNVTLKVLFRLAAALDIEPHIFLLPSDEFATALSQIPSQGIRHGRRPKSA